MATSGALPRANPRQVPQSTPILVIALQGPRWTAERGVQNQTPNLVRIGQLSVHKPNCVANDRSNDCVWNRHWK